MVNFRPPRMPKTGSSERHLCPSNPFAALGALDLRSSTGIQSPNKMSDTCSTSDSSETSVERKSDTTSTQMSFAQRARMRALAKEVLRENSSSPSPSPATTPKSDSWTTVRRKQSKVPKASLPQTKGYDKTVVGMSNQERIAAQAGRTRLCKHFLLGNCSAGDKCTYAHDISVLKPDEQKVFIGGIPSACTSRQLVAAIQKLGFEVLNIPKCHPSGFSPKVCMGSVEQAKELLKIARINVGGHTVDVRKFTDSRSQDEDNFCLTISGIPEGTSGYTLLQGLEKAGFPLVRSPMVEEGATVCQRCEMATIEQCDALLAIEALPCMETTLHFKEFKPYVKPTKKPKRASVSPRPWASRHNKSAPNVTGSGFGATQRRKESVNAFLNRAMSPTPVPVTHKQTLERYTEMSG